MSTLLDTLLIKIDADARGVKGVIQQAISASVSGVGSINKQEVDWTGIFSRSVSTAVIAGIAAEFGQAIMQYTQFQAATMNLNNVGTTATQGFASSINQLGGQAYSLANSAGASIGDTAQAFESFSKAGLDGASATYAVSEAAGIARTTGQSMGDVVTELVGLFQQWGVSTLPQVQSALTGLANAAGNGQFTFQELVNTISQQGTALAGKTDISSVAIQLASLSDQSGVSKQSILNDFTAISQAAASGLADPMNTLVGNMSTAISSGPNGLITAFDLIKTHVDQWGPAVANSVAAGMGLSAGDITNFEKTTNTAFTNSATASDTLRNHLIPLDTLIQDNTTDVQNLGIYWTILQNDVAQFALPSTIALLTTSLQGWDALFKSLATTGVPNFASAIAQISVDNLAAVLNELELVGSIISDIFTKNWSQIPKDIASAQATGNALSQDALGAGKPAAAAQYGVPSTDLNTDFITGPIAERLNNPGDLKYAGQAGATQDASGFASFSSFVTGWQALLNDLKAKTTANPSMSLLGLANMYAPASDGNNPQQYAATLAQQLGTSVNATLGSLSGNLSNLAVAVAHNEDSSNPNIPAMSPSPRSSGPTTVNNNFNFAPFSNSSPYFTANQIAKIQYSQFQGGQ